MTEQESEPEYGTNWIFFIFFVLIAIGLVLLLGLVFSHPASAYAYVTQGMSVNQSEYYDLSGIYGFSGELGWWKYWYNEGSDDLAPDKIIDLNSMNYHKVYIDPAVWNLGNWYQWDGLDKSNHGNTFVFRVVKHNSTVPKVQVTASTGFVIGTTISPVVTSPVTTPVPSPVAAAVTPVTIVIPVSPTPAVTAHFDKDQVIATQAVATMPTMKKADVPIEIPIFAVIGISCLWLFRRTDGN